MTVLCSIIVMVAFTKNVGIEAAADASGKVVAKSEYAYVVDFSKAAKEHNWVGDYSQKLVPKSKCVSMGGETLPALWEKR